MFVYTTILYTGMHYFSNCPKENVQVSVNGYVACNYEEKWWVGLILEVDVTQPPKNRDMKFPREIGGFKLSVSQEIYVRIPGSFLTLARISVVLISIIPT